MVVGKHKIRDNAVDTSKIAADTIIPADVDETKAYNFSNTSSTFGKVKGTLEVQAVQVAASAGANNFSWPSAFSGVPRVSYAIIHTSSTATVGVSINPTATGGTLNVSAASTVDIVGVYGF